jgi:hypothetical protein
LAVTLSSFAAVALAPLARAEGPGTMGSAKFLARGPAGLKIEGKTDALSCAPQGDLVRCALPVGTFTTGIDLRDQHLYEAIDSAGFPDARLEVARRGLSVPAAGAEASEGGKGSLTFHGQTKPVTFKYTAKRTAGFDVTASLTLDLREFAIEPPSYLGITVRPEVEVTVSFHLADVP